MPARPAYTVVVLSDYNVAERLVMHGRIRGSGIIFISLTRCLDVVQILTIVLQLPTVSVQQHSVQVCSLGAKSYTISPRCVVGYISRLYKCTL